MKKLNLFKFILAGLFIFTSCEDSLGPTLSSNIEQPSFTEAPSGESMVLTEESSEEVALELEWSKPIKDRLEGYKKALEELDISFNKKLVVKGDTMNRDGFTERAGYEAMMKILNIDPAPDACFCASDIQAVGALKAMQDAGKSIPIIGYDDIELAEYMGLSTIRQPMHEMGFIATQNLIDRTNNPTKAVSQTIYTPELIIRSSAKLNEKSVEL